MVERRAALAAAPLILVSVLACGESASSLPYGFDLHPRQSYRLEARDTTEVEGTPVVVERVAEFELWADPQLEGRAELALRLGRYYQSVAGAPGGASELSISRDGMLTRQGEREAALRPDALTPSGVTLAELLADPIGGWIIDARGTLLGTPWQSRDPLLGGVRVLDWLLLALPVVETGSRWGAERPIPPIGQYVLGVNLPIDYERTRSLAGDGRGVRASGKLERERIELAPDFAGRLQLEHTGDTALDAEGRVTEARLDLHVEFEAESGASVSSRTRLRIQCLSCGTASTPPVENEPERELESTPSRTGPI